MNENNNVLNQNILDSHLSGAGILIAICQSYGLEAAFAYLYRQLSAFGVVERLMCTMSARNDPVSLTFFEVPKTEPGEAKVRTPLLSRERQLLLYNSSPMQPYIVPDVSRDAEFCKVVPYKRGGTLFYPLVKAGRMAVFLTVLVADGRILNEDFIRCAAQARVLADTARSLLLKGYGDGLPSPERSALALLRQCACMAETVRVIEKLAGLKELVLITGETGSGKDVAARAIHESSSRAGGPFVRVNCGAIPDSLVDSAFFGYEQGAFTDAKQARPGYVEQADKGTLFLDEIGELSPAAQIRLLRVLERQEVQRVGGRGVLTMDVRIVAATHRDVQAMAAAGSFRKDLWFRLNVFPLRLPPLRERRADIPFLVRHFLTAKAAALGLPRVPEVPEDALYALYDYDWPGNVRELEHFVGRALVRAVLDGTEALLRFPAPGDGEEAVPAGGGWPTLEQMERTYIRQVAAHCGGRIAGRDGAAEVLGLNPSTLRSRMAKLGLIDGGTRRRKASPEGTKHGG